MANASLLGGVSEFNTAIITCNNMVVYSPPMREIVMNTFMVQIADTGDNDGDEKITTIVPYKAPNSKWAQFFDLEEGELVRPYRFLENIVLTQDVHPLIRTKSRHSSSMPVQKETTFHWEVEEGKFLLLGTQLTSKALLQFQEVLRKYKHAFAWSYKDLQGVKPEICQHYIDLEIGTKPVCQRQRRTNPVYAELVKAKITKLLDAGFIYPKAYSEWVFAIVIVPKKNKKIHICVDYRQLNSKTKKDHFPLPFTDQVLDRVAGHKLYSFLDGFSGYNQIQIHPDDQSKTTFTTKWGTFAYKVMPFGLCNAPATFQRVMMAAFQDFLQQWMEIFLDDFAVYGDEDDMVTKLELVFKRCIAMGISLNPDKCVFGIERGVLLGHVVSNDGVTVDDAKIIKIQDLPAPQNLRQLRGFLGHANYY